MAVTSFQDCSLPSSEAFLSLSSNSIQHVFINQNSLLMGDLNMNHPAAAINSEILFPMCKIKLNEIELPNGQHSFSLLVLTVKETMDICFLLKLYNIYQVR